MLLAATLLESTGFDFSESADADKVSVDSRLLTPQFTLDTQFQEMPPIDSCSHDAMLVAKILSRESTMPTTLSSFRAG